MSTRCQVLVKSSTKKHYNGKICTCPKYGKKFFKVQTNGRWRQEAVIGICESHLQTHSDPKTWKDRYSEGHVRWLGGTVQSYEEVDVSSLKDHQKNEKVERVKDKLKNFMGQRNVEKLTREEWQQLFQEALDEFCVETVMGA